MSQRSTWIVSVLLFAIGAHLLVHEFCDVSTKRWLVKGRLGRLGYEQLDYQSTGSRYSYDHNTTRVYLGPFSAEVPLSAASLLLAQITAPLIIVCFVVTKRFRKPTFSPAV